MGFLKLIGGIAFIVLFIGALVLKYRFLSSDKGPNRKLKWWILYCLRFFRPLPKGRLCYNTISLKGVSNGETKKLHP